MSAVIIAPQPNHGCIHVATDAAVYADGVVDSFRAKHFPIPHWPGVITNLGNAAVTILLGEVISGEFATFDDFVDGADDFLPDFLPRCGIPTAAEVIVAGFSRLRGPEAYSFRVGDDVPPVNSAEEVAGSPYWQREQYKLLKLPSQLVLSPQPVDQVVPAHWQGCDLDADPEEALWSIRKMLQMQRHTELPEHIGGVGGFAQVTSVFSDRIEQRVVTRWSEDKVGVRLRPAPLDWTRWHQENPRPNQRPASVLRLVK
jgi:hypothetical protein